MPTVLTVTGSPQSPSRTDGVVRHVSQRIRGRGYDVVHLDLRALPPAALLAADAKDAAIAAAVQQVVDADAVVVASPVFKASYSGLLKVFLDLLPQFALGGKAVLPLVTGGSPAHVLAVDYALRPGLASMNPAHIGPGWFVAADDVRLFPDGGVLLAERSARPLHDVVDAFLVTVDRLGDVHRTATAPGRGLSSLPAQGIEVIRTAVSDPLAAPLLADLAVEYTTRYGGEASKEMARFPDAEFESPDGAFVLLRLGGETVAGGAIRRWDDETAEVKRVWTAPRHRRQGLAGRVLIELERAALDLGYRSIHLTTGPRQPEATALYRSAGYTALYDETADPETVGPHPFHKDLRPEPVAVAAVG